MYALIDENACAKLLRSSGQGRGLCRYRPSTNESPQPKPEKVQGHATRQFVHPPAFGLSVRRPQATLRTLSLVYVVATQSGLEPY